MDTNPTKDAVFVQDNEAITSNATEEIVNNNTAVQADEHMNNGNYSQSENKPTQSDLKMKWWEKTWVKNTSKVAFGILKTILTVGISVFFSIRAMQAQEDANTIAQRNQHPDFQIEAVYQGECLKGYDLVISNGLVEHLDIQLERFVHLDTKGFITPNECYIPYNAITTYCAKPTETVYLDLFPKDPNMGGGVISPLDASNYINDMASLLDSVNPNSGSVYMFQTLDILTIQFTDFNRIRRTERYILYQILEDDECYMYPLDDTTMARIEALIPSSFERKYDEPYSIRFVLPNELYTYVDSNDYLSSMRFGYSRDIRLLELAKEYLVSLGVDFSHSNDTIAE